MYVSEIRIDSKQVDECSAEFLEPLYAASESFDCIVQLRGMTCQPCVTLIGDGKITENILCCVTVVVSDSSIDDM